MEKAKVMNYFFESVKQTLVNLSHLFVIYHIRQIFHDIRPVIIYESYNMPHLKFQNSLQKI